MTIQDKKDMDVLASVINASVQRGVFDTMTGVVQVNNAMANLIARLDLLAAWGDPPSVKQTGKK